MYRCCHGHEVKACHPAILELLKENLEPSFLLTHQCGFTLDLANVFEQLVDSGMSFEQVKNIIHNHYRSTYDHFEASFWRDLEFSKTSGINYDQKDLYFPPFSSELFQSPSVDLLIDIFLKRFFQNEDLYKSSMNSLDARWITCDHTFKSVCNIGYTKLEDRSWVYQYNSIFCVLNERGKV